MLVESATALSTPARPYRIEHESLASLEKRAHPGNPKDHDLGAIIQSINRFGFTSPVMVDEATGTLVAGHGRLQALRAMQLDGYDPPEGVQTGPNEPEGWSVPVIRGISFKSEDDRDAYLIADNNLTIKGGWEMAQLTDMLEALATRDPEHGLDGTGFDMDDLENLLADKNFEPPESPPQELVPQFGVWLRVPDKLAENALCDLLEKYGYEKFRRMSEDS